MYRGQMCQRVIPILEKQPASQEWFEGDVICLLDNLYDGWMNGNTKS